MIALILLLHEHGALPLSALARRLHASEATIRRDVSTLASQRLLERTHGGARRVRVPRQLPERLRDCVNFQAKGPIASAAARMIEAGSQTVGMTGGSTTKLVLKALGARRDLTIITNSLSIGREAVEHGHSKTLVVGGVLRHDSLELVGPLAEGTLGCMGLGTAIVGAEGFSASYGLSTSDEMGAPFHRSMIQGAERVIVVADSSKIGLLAGVRVCDLSDVDHLVTDAGAPAQEIHRIRNAGVDVTVVANVSTSVRTRAT